VERLKMEQISVLKLRLLKEADIHKLGPKSKSLLDIFSSNQNCTTQPQKTFVESVLLSGLIGPESIVLSSRLKCEHIIKYVFNDMKLSCDIDSLSPELMVVPKLEENIFK